MAFLGEEAQKLEKRSEDYSKYLTDILKQVETSNSDSQRIDRQL